MVKKNTIKFVDHPVEPETNPTMQVNVYDTKLGEESIEDWLKFDTILGTAKFPSHQTLKSMFSFDSNIVSMNGPNMFLAKDSVYQEFSNGPVPFCDNPQCPTHKVLMKNPNQDKSNRYGFTVVSDRYDFFIEGVIVHSRMCDSCYVASLFNSMVEASGFCNNVKCGLHHALPTQYYTIAEKAKMYSSAATKLKEFSGDLIVNKTILARKEMKIDGTPFHYCPACFSALSLCLGVDSE